MKNPSFDHGFGKLWNDIFVEKRERYKTAVTDFHEHDFYEINLILSGNIKVVAGNMSVEGTTGKIVLARPNTPHFISCKGDVLYSSIYLVFSEEFIKSFDVECMELMSVFGDNGATFAISDSQLKVCANIMDAIEKEEKAIRKKFLVFYLLSYINDISKEQYKHTQHIPEYIYKVVSYIESHYAEKIIARDLAEKIYVGRTTLMMHFKKYTGKTLHEYVTYCRLRNAIRLLSEGKTEFETATACGFGDSSAFIQCFKRIFKMPPREYIKNYIRS